MAPRLSTIEVARIEYALSDPRIPLTRNYLQLLAKQFKCHLNTIYHHKRRVLAHMPPQHFSGGPRRIITWEMEQAVKLLLDQQLDPFPSE